MLKIAGVRELGQAPVIDIEVCASGEPILLRAAIDTGAEFCVFDTGLMDALANRVDITLRDDCGGSLKICDVSAVFSDLFGADARLGWSALEHLSIVMLDDHSFEIRGHSIL